jgi:hypothetical protein
MHLPNAMKRLATLTAVTGLALAGVTATAHAAPSIGYVTQGIWGDGSRVVHANINGNSAGVLTWDADGRTSMGTTGDSLYAKDKASDGYAIRSQVRYRNGSIIKTISTSGHTAPYTAKFTRNMVEGTPLQVRICVTKGSTVHGCSNWYSAHA